MCGGEAAMQAHIYFFPGRKRKPICLRPASGGDINCRIASNTTLNFRELLLQMFWAESELFVLGGWPGTNKNWPGWTVPSELREQEASGRDK